MSKHCKMDDKEKVENSCCKEAEREENQEVKDPTNEAEDIINNENSEADLNSQEENVVIDETVLLKKQLEVLKEENSKLKEENKLHSNKLKAIEEKYSNLFNEYDNYRKRTSKEKESIFNDSCEKILKEFLPVLDNLERAAAAEGSVEDLKSGVDMIIKSFQSALEKLEVEEIPTEGEFDPNVHNAVMHIENEELGKNQVAQVFQKGYKRGEKVLRHSMVQVAN